MIISRTPFRISLFGGGTDYPSWYLKHGGAVLGTTINKYCYISVRPLPPFFDVSHRIVYSKIELVKDIADIQHPAVRAVLQETGIDIGLEIHHDGDLPARSGLGSSSSFTVGMLNAISALRGRMASSKFLADEAIRTEQKVIGEHVGSQDQIWAAYGGTNLIEFSTDGTYSVKPVIMLPERRQALQSHMLLFFTGISRFASEVAEKKIANLDKKERQLFAIRRMVDDGLSILRSERTPLRDIGALLHEGWMMKRELAEGVSTPVVDEIYNAGMAAGAYGGKLLGAGGGGFILFFAPPERHAAIRERLSSLIQVQIEIGSPGSRIVVYEPNGLEFS